MCEYLLSCALFLTYPDSDRDKVSAESELLLRLKFGPHTHTYRHTLTAELLLVIITWIVTVELALWNNKSLLVSALCSVSAQIIKKNCKLTNTPTHCDHTAAHQWMSTAPLKELCSMFRMLKSP